MAQLFQSPKTQTHSPCMQYAPILLSHSQSATIEHLRRENLFLKQQLEAMMKNQNVKKAPSNQIATKMSQLNSEQQAEQAYKDKICRLKMKKSPRDSLDRTYTIPNSPRNSMQHKNSTNNKPLNSLGVSQLANNNQNDRCTTPPYLGSRKNSKIIVSSKQKDFYSHQASNADSRVFTVRKNTPSQHKVVGLIPSNQNATNARQKYQDYKIPLETKPWRPTHQRVQTYQPQSIYLAQKTQRMQNTRCNSPFSPVNNSEKLRINSKGPNLHQQSANNYRMSQQVQQKASMFFQRRQLSSKKTNGNNNISLKVNVNKGAANNVKQIKILNKQVENKKRIDQSPEGDSCLSIQRNMRQEGVSTRLRYNVYMQQGISQN